MNEYKNALQLIEKLGVENFSIPTTKVAAAYRKSSCKM
jgi:hypothetical protein